MQVVMVDEDIIARVAALLGVKAHPIRPRRAEWQPTYLARVRGAPAVAWMTALRPYLGRRRREQVDRALAGYAPRYTRKLKDADALRGLDGLAAGLSVREVAVDLGVTVWCIYHLRHGRTHKHLDHPVRRTLTVPRE